jgi:uncharacterized repeat protein (TIGR01451 family)
MYSIKGNFSAEVVGNNLLSVIDTRQTRMYYIIFLFLCQEECPTILYNYNLDRYPIPPYTSPNTISMKHLIIVVFTFIYISLLWLYMPEAHAAGAPTPTCVPVFGGGSPCNGDAAVVVNKQVRDPKSGRYVDNLSGTYDPGQAVTFHIFFTNTSNKDLTGILIQDTFPRYLSYTDGDGKFDFTKQIFTANLTSLKKGQSKALSVTGTIVSADKIPSSPSPLCVTNVATVTQEGKTSSDSVPFCIRQSASAQPEPTKTAQTTTRNVQPGSTTKGGLPIYSQSNAKTNKTPDTGPEELGYVAILLSSMGGFYLRKKTPMHR